MGRQVGLGDRFGLSGCLVDLVKDKVNTEGVESAVVGCSDAHHTHREVGNRYADAVLVVGLCPFQDKALPLHGIVHAVDIAGNGIEGASKRHTVIVDTLGADFLPGVSVICVEGH